MAHFRYNARVESDPQFSCEPWSHDAGEGARVKLYEAGEGARVKFYTPSGWRVTARVQAIGGRPIVTELHVESRVPGAVPEVESRRPSGRRQAVGIDSEVLREIHMGELYRAAARWLAEQLSEESNPFALIVQASGFDFANAPAKARRPGRPGPPPADDEEILRYARAYAEAFQRGDRAPMAAVVAIVPLNSRNPDAYAKKAIHQARHERGLLTSYGQGKAGGELTPKAKALLKKLADRQTNG